MNIGVVGSRSWHNDGLLIEWLTCLWNKHPDWTIVSGEARGVDTLAKEVAQELGMEYIPCPPNIPKGASRAETVRLLYERNTTIVLLSQVIVCFYDTSSQTQGCLDTCAKALDLGKPVIIHTQDGWWTSDTGKYLKGLNYKRKYTKERFVAKYTKTT